MEAIHTQLICAIDIMKKNIYIYIYISAQRSKKKQFLSEVPTFLWTLHECKFSDSVAGRNNEVKNF